EAAPVLPAAPQQVAERVPRVVTAEDALAHLVERLPDVVRGRQRVRPVVKRSVSVVSHLSCSVRVPSTVVPPGATPVLAPPGWHRATWGGHRSARSCVPPPK